MNIANETMSLVCGDSMLDTVSFGATDVLTRGDWMAVPMSDAFNAVMQFMQGGMMDGGSMSVGTGILLFVGWITSLLLLGGLGVLAVWGSRRLVARSGQPRSARPPLEIARERYARGELDRDEFRTIRSNLTTG